MTMPPLGDDSGPRAFVDLHCHTNGSFDSLADPGSVVRAAEKRGITHLAITDHEKIDAALRARDAAPSGLTVIIGEECKTADGDLICLFLEKAVPPGRPALETIAAVREQGGLVGIPHPFDRFRGSMAKLIGEDRLAEIAAQADWIETYNARVVGGGNDTAVQFAHAHDLRGVAASDAHFEMEVGVAYTVLIGRPETPAGLLAALPTAHPVFGRASYLMRALMPVNKLVNRMRGNVRITGSARG